MVGLGLWGANRGVPGETVAWSVALGLAVGLLAAAFGHAAAGVGIALGLLIGSANGYLIVALLDRSAFVYASLMRLACLTALAVGGALLLQSSAWTVLLGVGAAQFVMVAAGVRRGLRS